MAGYRFWRVLGMDNVANELQRCISRIQLREVENGTDVAPLAASITISPVINGGGSPADLLDNNPLTFVLWTNQPYCWVMFDFELGFEKEIVEVVITAPGEEDPPNINRLNAVPHLILVQFSNDGVTWSGAFAGYEDTWAYAQSHTFTRPDHSVEGRYWGVLDVDVNDATGVFAVAEIVMKLDPYGSSVIGSGDAFMINENTDPSLTADKAFDGDPNTRARSNTSNARDILGYDFGVSSDQHIRQILVQAENVSGDPLKAPRNGSIVRSNDFKNWEVMSSFNDLTWTGSEIKELYREPYIAQQVTFEYDFEPYPLPLLDVIPDDPIEEHWSWWTVMSTAYGAKEQRAALRTAPRYTYQLSHTLPDGEFRVAQYNRVMKLLGNTFLFPLFPYMTPITDSADGGETQVFFDPELTDIREGESLAILNPADNTMVAYEVETLEVDGAILSSPLTFPVVEGMTVMPTMPARMAEGDGISMGAVLGASSLVIESMSRRTLETAQTPSLVTLFAGLAVIDRRPIAVNDLPELFSRGIQVYDNGMSLPREYTAWDHPFFNGERQWLLETLDDMAFWKDFCAMVRGKQKSFLLPTFREDLALAEVIEASNTALILATTNIGYLNYFAFDTYKRLQLETNYGRTHVTVTSVEEVGGEAVLTIAGNFDNYEVSKASFMNRVRFDTDTISIQHYRHYSILRASIRSVDA